MTTPQQPQQSQQNYAQIAAQDAALVTAVAGVLLSAVSVAAAMTGLTVILHVQKRRDDAMEAALEIVMGFPPDREGFFGPASREMARMNLLRRAQFTVTAMKRLTSDAVQARAQGQSIPRALLAGMTRERRYYALHLLAIWGRAKAGAQVDVASMTYGNVLGWHTVRDRNTTAECLAASGKNFYADHMPLIGYPGAVHPHCRCLPGAPFPGGRILPSYGVPQAGRYRRAA